MVNRTTWLQKVAFTVWVLLIVSFAIFPFLQMVSTSLKYSWDWGNPSLLPTKINLERYAEILGFKEEVDLDKIPANIRLLLNNPKLNEQQKKQIIARYIDKSYIFPFKKYFLNSIIIAGLASFIALCIAILGAYAISRLRFPGRKVLSRAVIFVYMFGGILLLIPLYRMMGLMGLLRTATGSAIALMIVYIVQTIPVSLYMLGNYFRSIPKEMEESAIIDGCSRMAIIIKIIVPLSLGAIATVYIYAFMIAWNEYLFSSVFLKAFPRFHTLPLGLRAVFTAKNAVWDLVMASSVLTSMPVIVLFSFIQKNLVQGMTNGSVKG